MFVDAGRQGQSFVVLALRTFGVDREDSAVALEVDCVLVDARNVGDDPDLLVGFVNVDVEVGPTATGVPVDVDVAFGPIISSIIRSISRKNSSNGSSLSSRLIPTNQYVRPFQKPSDEYSTCYQTPSRGTLTRTATFTINHSRSNAHKQTQIYNKSEKHFTLTDCLSRHQ